MDYDEDYLHFYEAYPRKEGKADGQKAWKSMPLAMKQAALADVEKRNRHHAWSSNKKLIALPATYLRGSRWDDDWLDTLESSRKPENEITSKGEVDYQPIADNFRGSKWAAMGNRLMLRYLRHRRGLPHDDLPRALKIKNDTVREVEQWIDDEIASDDRDRQMDAVWTFAELILNRLDKAFGTEIKPLILSEARQ